MGIYTEHLGGMGQRYVSQSCLETLLRDKSFIYSFTDETFIHLT